MSLSCDAYSVALIEAPLRMLIVVVSALVARRLASLDLLVSRLWSSLETPPDKRETTHLTNSFRRTRCYWYLGICERLLDATVASFQDAASALGMRTNQENKKED